jgi:hypothetical protein
MPPGYTTDRWSDPPAGPANGAAVSITVDEHALGRWGLAEGMLTVEDAKGGAPS